MNRNKRRYLQWKETLQMKLTVLIKQKQDIKGSIDDYFGQVMKAVNEMPRNEEDSSQDFQRHQRINEVIDAASKVLTQLAIAVDKVLDGEDEKIALTTENPDCTSQNPEVAQSRFIQNKDLLSPAAYLQSQQNERLSVENIIEHAKFSSIIFNDAKEKVEENVLESNQVSEKEEELNLTQNANVFSQDYVFEQGKGVEIQTIFRDEGSKECNNREQWQREACEVRQVREQTAEFKEDDISQICYQQQKSELVPDEKNQMSDVGRGQIKKTAPLESFQISIQENMVDAWGNESSLAEQVEHVEQFEPSFKQSLTGNNKLNKNINVGVRRKKEIICTEFLGTLQGGSESDSAGCGKQVNKVKCMSEEGLQELLKEAELTQLSWMSGVEQADKCSYQPLNARQILDPPASVSQHNYLAECHWGTEGRPPGQDTSQARHANESSFQSGSLLEHKRLNKGKEWHKYDATESKLTNCERAGIGERTAHDFNQKTEKIGDTLQHDADIDGQRNGCEEWEHGQTSPSRLHQIPKSNQHLDPDSVGRKESRTVNVAQGQEKLNVNDDSHSKSGLTLSQDSQNGSSDVLLPQKELSPASACTSRRILKGVRKLEVKKCSKQTTPSVSDIQQNESVSPASTLSSSVSVASSKSSSKRSPAPVADEFTLTYFDSSAMAGLGCYHPASVHQLIDSTQGLMGAGVNTLSPSLSFQQNRPFLSESGIHHVATLQEIPPIAYQSPCVSFMADQFGRIIPVVLEGDKFAAYASAAPFTQQQPLAGASWTHLYQTPVCSLSNSVPVPNIVPPPPMLYPTSQIHQPQPQSIPSATVCVNSVPIVSDTLASKCSNLNTDDIRSSLESSASNPELLHSLVTSTDHCKRRDSEDSMELPDSVHKLLQKLSKSKKTVAAIRQDNAVPDMLPPTRSFERVPNLRHEGLLKGAHQLTGKTKKSSRGSANLLELIKQSEKNVQQKSEKRIKVGSNEDHRTETSSQSAFSDVSDCSCKEHVNHSPQTAPSKRSTSAHLFSHIWPIQPAENTMYPAVISSLTHPWSFHVQLLDGMEFVYREIRQAVETKTLRVATPECGMICLVKFNENYYRSKVLSVEDQDCLQNSVKVLLIDLGNQQVVAAADIFSMPESLLQYPGQAIFCALSGVGPRNTNWLWTEEAILEFHKNTNNRQIEVLVVHLSLSVDTAQSSFPHLIDIVFGTSSDKSSSPTNGCKEMSRHLIEKGFAKEIKYENQIVALGEMYLPINSEKKMKEKDDRLTITSAPSKFTHISDFKRKVTQPLRFLKPKDKSFKTSVVPSESSTSKTSSSMSTNSISISAANPVLDSPESDLSYLVDDKLHTLGRVIRCSQLDLPSPKTVDISELKTKQAFPLNSASQTSGKRTEVEIFVTVSAVISPSSFFVYRVDEDHVRQLKTLECSLRSQSISIMTHSSASFKPAKNSLVCAICSEDGFFYRGLVLDFISQDKCNKSEISSLDKLLIFFIDYGDFEWVLRRNVFPLPSEFKKLTPFVLWCSLKCVSPFGYTPVQHSNTSGMIRWPPEAVCKFKSLVSENRMFSAVMSESSFQQISNITSLQFEPTPVYLVDKTSQAEVCINHELILLSLASFSPDSTQPAGQSEQPTSLDRNISEEWDPMKEEFSSIRNSYKVDIDDAGVALVGHAAGKVGKGGQRLCPHFNKNKGCYRGDKCPHLHIQMELSNIPHDRVPVSVFEEDQSELLPQPESAVAVTVSTVITPGLFYVTLPWGRLTLQQLHRDQAMLKEYLHEETLESMMDRIQDYYSKCEHYDGDLTLLARGQAVAAKVQDLWLRAKVIETDVEGGQVQVLSVDFGFLCWVEERNIRELLTQFLHLTPQAVECSLADLQPQDVTGGWSEEICDQFAEMVSGRVLIAKVKYRYPSGHISVVLYESVENTSINFNQFIVDCGMARYADHEDPETGPESRPSCNFVPV